MFLKLITSTEFENYNDHLHKTKLSIVKIKIPISRLCQLPNFLIISNSQLKILILTWKKSSSISAWKIPWLQNKKKFRPMLYRSAVFTLVFAALEKFMWHLCLTPLHSRVLFRKSLLHWAIYLPTSAWHFCLLCVHFSTRSSQKFIQLDLLQKFLYK